MKIKILTYIFVLLLELVLGIFLYHASIKNDSMDYFLQYEDNIKSNIPEGYFAVEDDYEIVSAHYYQNSDSTLIYNLELNRRTYEIDDKYTTNYLEGDVISQGNILAESTNETIIMPFDGRLVLRTSHSLVIEEMLDEITIIHPMVLYENIQDYTYQLYYNNYYYPLIVSSINYHSFSQEYYVLLKGVKGIIKNQINGMQVKIIESMGNSNLFQLPVEMISQDINGFYLNEVLITEKYGKIMHKKYVTIIEDYGDVYIVQGISLGTLIANIPKVD